MYCRCCETLALTITPAKGDEKEPQTKKTFFCTTPTEQCQHKKRTTFKLTYEMATKNILFSVRFISDFTDVKMFYFLITGNVIVNLTERRATL